MIQHTHHLAHKIISLKHQYYSFFLQSVKIFIFSVKKNKIPIPDLLTEESQSSIQVQNNKNSEKKNFDRAPNRHISLHSSKKKGKIPSTSTSSIHIAKQEISQRRNMENNKMPVFPNFPQVPSFKDPNYIVNKKVKNYIDYPEALIASIGDLVAKTWNKN